MAARVAVVFHPDLLSLDFGEGHPLRSDRYSNFLSLFSRLGLDSDPRFEKAGCAPATRDDLLLAHSADYLSEVERIAEERGHLTMDTPLSPDIVRGSMLAVGGALEAGRRVADGSSRHVLCFGGFHHAGEDYGGGFCVFNDVAVLARSLVRRHGRKRVMVIDTDAHAGDGTEDIFASDPSVLVVSMHQDPTTIFPGKCFAHEIGNGAGRGFTANIPLPLMSELDEYQRVFQEIVLPLSREFRPEVLIRNGGSDPHYADELTQLGLCVADFKWLGAMVREAAQGAPLVDMYGSGYNPKVLPSCWMAMLSGTSGINIQVPRIDEGRRPEIAVTPGLATQKDLELSGTLLEVRNSLKPYWKCFR
jgi:acetoin utilization protein AcuC